VLAQAHSPRKALFAQVLECDLDAFIIELLIVSAKLIAAIGAAKEELTDQSHRSMRLSLEECRASDVHRAVEIKVVCAMRGSSSKKEDSATRYMPRPHGHPRQHTTRGV
jgi:hypothetical protein